MLLKHFFSLILICFVSKNAFSQKALCDTIPFRGQTICLQSVQLKSLSREFADGDGAEKGVRNVSIYRLDHYDSVVVKMDSGLSSVFLTSELYKVISPWIIYKSEGDIFVDSFTRVGDSIRYSEMKYFVLFTNAWPVYTTWNQKDNSSKYYSIDRRDSATVYRYPNGITKKIQFYDGSSKLFYKSGRLHYLIRAAYDTTEYYPNGVLRMSMKYFDKRTNKIDIRKEFYGNKRLRSESFYIRKQSRYYYTAKTYDKTGILLKQVYKKMPQSLSLGRPVEVPAPADRLFTTVMQEAEFAGGWMALGRKLNGILFKLDGDSGIERMFLGEYKVTVNIDSLGNFTVTDAVGKYLPNEMRRCISQVFSSDRWRPYGFQIWRFNATYIWTIRVRGYKEPPPVQY